MTSTSSANDAPIIEIVTFRLAEGSDEKAFLDAAMATEDLLHRKGAKIENRVLVKDDTGIWSDVIHWHSGQQARAIAAEVVSAPEFQPFMAMIEPDTVTMRHSSIHWTMG